jgi:thiol-disulfide isomerase/thioredoxin
LNRAKLFIDRTSCLPIKFAKCQRSLAHGIFALADWSVVGRLKQVLEVTTSIGVLIAVITLGAFLYHNWFHSGNIAPRDGDRLPHLSGYDWSSSPETLVFAVRQGCHFCEDSMPFYRKLAELEKAHRLKANLLMVFPDSSETANKVLHLQNVNLQVISGVSLKNLGVGGTPTLILADSKGKVTNFWVGEQGEDGQDAIIKAVEQ